MIGPLKGSSKRLSYGVFPTDKRSSMFRRKVKHSSESAHHFSSRPDCNNTALCVLLSQDLPLFPICVVSTYNDSRKDLHKLCQINGIVSVNDFRIPFGFQELFQAPVRFLRSFCFARVRLDPLGGQVLHHDCISVIVSRFTTFTENFVICCTQLAKIFRTRYDSANASFARGRCDFGPLEDLAIVVFREVSINTVFTQIHTSRRLQR